MMSKCNTNAINFAVYSSEYAVFRQNLFVVNTMQICRRYFAIKMEVIYLITPSERQKAVARNILSVSLLCILCPTNSPDKEYINS